MEIDSSDVGSIIYMYSSLISWILQGFPVVFQAIIFIFPHYCNFSLQWLEPVANLIFIFPELQGINRKYLEPCLFHQFLPNNRFAALKSGKFALVFVPNAFTLSFTSYYDDGLQIIGLPDLEILHI